MPEQLKPWLLIQNHPDRRYLWLDDQELARLLRDPDYASVRRFIPGSDAAPEPAPRHWEDGDALLLRVKPVVPVAVATAWALPD
jgi:hypothetical protein